MAVSDDCLQRNVAADTREASPGTALRCDPPPTSNSQVTKELEFEHDATKSAAMVILRPPADQANWHDRQSHPLLVRVAVLPPRLGTTITDNNGAELLSLKMALKVLPQALETCIIMDSLTISGNAITLRDGTDESDRQRIRDTMGGVTKTRIPHSRMARITQNCATCITAAVQAQVVV
jgi:hypothetical protein